MTRSNVRGAATKAICISMLLAIGWPVRGGEAIVEKPRPGRSDELPKTLPGELPPGPEPSPDKLPAQFHGDLGQIYLQHAQWTKAEECFREAYGKEPDASLRATYAYRLGQLLTKKKAYDQALPMLTEALDRSKSQPNAFAARQGWLTLAALHERKGELDKAEDALRRWLADAPKGYERTMALRQLLVFLQRVNRLDQAVQAYEQILAKTPGDRDALEALKVVYSQLKPDRERALVLIERLVTADPDNMEAVMQLVGQYDRTGKRDKAIELIKGIMPKRPEEREFLTERLAHLYIANGQKDEALAQIKTLVGEGPGTVESHRRAADLYQRMGLTDQAIEHYRKAAQLAGTESDRDHHLLAGAQAARSGKKYDQAEELARQLARSPSKPIAAQAKRLLFEIYEEQNKLDELKLVPPGK